MITEGAARESVSARSSGAVPFHHRRTAGDVSRKRARARPRQSLGQVDIPDADSDAVAAHLKMVARRMLAAGPPDADPLMEQRAKSGKQRER